LVPNLACGTLYINSLSESSILKSKIADYLKWDALKRFKTTFPFQILLKRFNYDCTNFSFNSKREDCTTSSVSLWAVLLCRFLAWHHALLIDVALLGIFGVQHSVMARQGFKTWWTQFIPQPVERSTYVLFSSLCLIALFYLWQPIGGTVWTVRNPTGVAILYTLFALGWLLVPATTFLINHFDLFGLRQVWLYLRDKEYIQLKFATPGLYRYVRHPLYVGWLLAFWSIPTMTVTHLAFAVVTTVYILIAIQFEERDLVDIHGNAYAGYRRQVPMLVPFTKSGPARG
jgi:methanethiol S-methyltransferase